MAIHPRLLVIKENKNLHPRALKYFLKFLMANNCYNEWVAFFTTTMGEEVTELKELFLNPVNYAYEDDRSRKLDYELLKRFEDKNGYFSDMDLAFRRHLTDHPLWGDKYV